ncbi:MAG: patatin-like phospholipase family protein [Gemmatimonadales bacterium]
MRGITLSATMLFAFAAGATAQTPCVRGGTALVLSGGGAKGLAHIGVLRALDSLGIHPDLIVGSSMGAVIGALYASGHSPAGIDSLFRAIPSSSAFHSDIRVMPRALGPLRPVVSWEQTDHGLELQRSAVKDGPINALLSATLLTGDLAARGDFCRLPIPFYAVATDLQRRQAVALGTGDLALAVRSSMAIPLVFEPVRLDGRYLADGGLTANTPVTVARELGAERLIISEMIQQDEDSVDLASPLTLANYLLTFLFRQPGDTAFPSDVMIRSDVTGIGNLDFTIASLDTAEAHGYAATLAAFSAPRAKVDGRSRAVPVNVVPILASVSTTGLKDTDARDLLQALSLRPGSPVDTVRLRNGLLDLARSDRFRGVWLHPDTGAPGDSLHLRLEVQKAPTRVAGLGLAYDNELGARLWIGGVDWRIVDRAAEASAAAFFGGLETRIALGLRRTWRSSAIPRPTITLTLSDQQIRTFDGDGNQLAKLDAEQAVGFVGLEKSFGSQWVVDAGLVGRAWAEPAAAHQRSGGVRFRVLRSDPESDSRVDLSLEWADQYRRASFEWQEPIHWGRVTLTPGLRAGIGDSLPLQLTFPLGGDDGFPGLHIYELRGDRELFGSMTIAIPIAGSLELRAQGATGQVAFGNAGMALDGWHVGGRIGLGISTPLGPARLEYGVTRGFRNQVVLRVGRWF